MTRRTKNGAFARIALTCAVAGAALACHTPTNAVPRLAVGFELGGGPRPTRVGRTYFREDESGLVARAVASAGIGRLGPVFPVVRVETNAGTSNHTDICLRTPYGGCQQGFPTEPKFGAALGVAYPLTESIAITGVAGRSMNERSDYNASDPMRRFVDAQLSYAATRYFGITANMRYVWWNDPEYGSLWHRPVTVGLRMQWP